MSASRSWYHLPIPPLERRGSYIKLYAPTCSPRKAGRRWGDSDITTRRTLRRVKKKRIFRAAFTKKQPQIMLLPGAALKMLGIRKYCRFFRLAPKQNIENPREEPV